MHLSSLQSHRSTFSVLLSVVFLDNIGYAIVVPYLYFYLRALGGSTLLYGVLLASYSLMSFIFTPLVARFSDRYGRRKILLAALAVSSFSYTMKVVPLPSWLSKETVPPNDSVIRLITAKPKP